MLTRGQSALLLSGVIAAVSVFIISLIPSPIDPVPIYLSDQLPVLDGPLQINSRLQKVTKLFSGQLLGPESFAVGPDGSIYTGTGDGRIWRFKDGHMSMVARTGIDHPDCGKFHMEPVCGRPKGIKMNSKGYLIVADSYKGILEVNVDTGDIRVLLDIFLNFLEFNGSRFVFLNGLDIGSDGTIYFSDSSTKWERRNYRYEVIETNKLGRVIALNPLTLQARLLQDGLYLANGLCLAPDDSFLLVAEMSISRISKIYLKGPNTGQVEVLIDNLPGYPDNIKENDRGNYYVGMGSVRFQGSSPIGSFLDIVSQYPSIKRIVTKVLPSLYFDVFLPRHGLLLEISSDGEIVTSHHDPGAKVIWGISEAYQYGDGIYFGNFKQDFIGYISKSELYV
ncbi:unnamed protein product [Lymnaea stagnalis]|uniref:Strictosidine synthase conserved region domain-containing protein n=1 Tax=Lymnaea stagnalis TaxID=6523 RepID=A0AAV2IH43_LYMST